MSRDAQKVHWSRTTGNTLAPQTGAGQRPAIRMTAHALYHRHAPGDELIRNNPSGSLPGLGSRIAKGMPSVGTGFEHASKYSSMSRAKSLGRTTSHLYLRNTALRERLSEWASSSSSGEKPAQHVISAIGSEQPWSERKLSVNETQEGRPLPKADSKATLEG